MSRDQIAARLVEYFIECAAAVALAIVIAVNMVGAK
jgi:hypothetical protein